MNEAKFSQCWLDGVGVLSVRHHGWCDSDELHTWIATGVDSHGILLFTAPPFSLRPISDSPFFSFILDLFR